MANVPSANDSNFETVVLKAGRPVLVDFWGDHCPPCVALAPVFEELAQEYSGKVDFVKLNVEENRKVTAAYSILSIPTLILFKDGKPAQQIVGFRGKAALKKILEAM
ncbi:MAG: thioredoxin [Chloroflexi bacterium]|nr:thioredoxin [Chloroflexota bacterium]